MTEPRAQTILREGFRAAGYVTLDYGERLLRRKRLIANTGKAFVVDLAHVTHLEPGQAFLLETGEAIEVRAAQEALLHITGDLARLAWHIGNRHTPCAILPDHLLIQNDPVLRDMLIGLGAEVREARGPFRPEGGAYGQGRTMGHEHHTHTHEH
ncbi:MAG: urease accessory protein UreE [Pseudomonadota bacterium]